MPVLAKSKLLLVAITILIALILLLSSFRLGMTVGFHKASFSCNWGKNYHRLFGGPRHGWVNQFDSDDYISSTGVVGAVMEVTSSTITVRGNDNVEKSIFLDSSTIIRKNNNTITSADLKVDDRITAIGSASTSGQLEAKFIRVFDAK